MSLSRRITLVAAAAVAVAIVLASALTYVAVRDQLRGQVDTSLRRQGGSLAAPEGVSRLQRRLGRGGDRFRPLEPRAPLGGPAGYMQLVTPSGSAIRAPDNTIALPIDPRVRTLAGARHTSQPYLRDARVAGSHVRILTVGVPSVGAVEIARPLDEVDHVLDRMRLILLVLGTAGVGLAAILGWLVARATIVPVRRLTAATEHVATTQDLGRRIEVEGSDELSRLAASFNNMLGALQGSASALDESVRAQRQLVADASHELRTPLTSLRTNIEVLERSADLSQRERASLLSDVKQQIEELTELMSDVIELARGGAPVRETSPVRLDRIVAESIERAERHAHGVTLERELEPCIVEGAPERLARAVNNLIDNAIKFSAPGGSVEITVRDGEVGVRDHGPGIAVEDLPHIFDRFYRSADARRRPGSGLGLAIVRQVAEGHGGGVSAEAADGGGARLRLRLPVSAGPLVPQE